MPKVSFCTHIVSVTFFVQFRIFHFIIIVQNLGHIIHERRKLRKVVPTQPGMFPLLQEKFLTPLHVSWYVKLLLIFAKSLSIRVENRKKTEYLPSFFPKLIFLSTFFPFWIIVILWFTSLNQIEEVRWNVQET